MRFYPCRGPHAKIRIGSHLGHDTYVMFLGHGWKTLACAHNFMSGYVLRIKLVEANMLSIKIYGHSGTRLGCCEESSSDHESSSSSDSDEEDSVGEDGNNEPQAVKLE